MTTKTCKKCNEPYEVKTFRRDDDCCKICSPHKNLLCSRELIGAILLVSFVFFVWIYFLGGPESQLYGMSRTNQWIDKNKSEWQELQQKYPGLKEVKMNAFTGNNGCLIVVIPKGISEKDELILYRFLMKYNVNRPIKIVKL